MGYEEVDVLNFLFMLGALEFGKGYALDSLSETQKRMFEDFKHLGLVYQRKVGYWWNDSKWIEKVDKVLSDATGNFFDGWKILNYEWRKRIYCPWD